MTTGTGNYGGTTARWEGGRLVLDYGNSAGLIIGGGSALVPVASSTVNGHFIEWRFSNTAATGTARGEYLRLYLTGGAGGEALRAFTTNSAAAPVDTINGAHISLNFSGAGNVTGQAAASRLTYHVPGANLGGTNAVAQLDAWADGAASAVTGNMSFIRATLGGNATGLSAIEDAAYLLSISGGTNASGNMVGAVGNEPTWTSKTHLIRVNLNGTLAYLVAVQP